MNECVLDQTLTLPLSLGKGEATHAGPETLPTVSERGFCARRFRSR
jgi:hypothetical protein